MRKIKVGELNIEINALKRRQIKGLVKDGFQVSTVSIHALSSDQWDDFVDALIKEYCGLEKAAVIISAMDGMEKAGRRKIELELIAETWGAEEEEKN